MCCGLDDEFEKAKLEARRPLRELLQFLKPELMKPHEGNDRRTGVRDIVEEFGDKEKISQTYLVWG